MSVVVDTWPNCLQAEVDVVRGVVNATCLNRACEWRKGIFICFLLKSGLWDDVCASRWISEILQYDKHPRHHDLSKRPNRPKLATLNGKAAYGFVPLVNKLEWRIGADVD